MQQRITVEDLLTMRTGHLKGPSGATWRRLRSSWIDEYFALPVEEEPGTRFVYSSATSHMLSAIVQRATGEPVSEYLRARLFDPLGIGAVDWQRDPEGFCSGGNGLSLRPADFLKWGRLQMQHGAWEGAQIVPSAWIEASTTPWVADASLRWNGEGFEPAVIGCSPDRAPQGYGYHVWTSDAGMYFASGIFGQLCIVSPEDDTVIVTTASMPDERGAGLLTEVVAHLLPALRSSVTVDARAQASLDRRLRSETTPRPLVAPTAVPQLHVTFDCVANADDLATITLDTIEERSGHALEVSLVDRRGHHTVRCGFGRWIEGETTVTRWRLHHSYQPDSSIVVAAAEWLGPTTLALYWNFIESPFNDIVIVQWRTDDEIQILRGSNVNSGPTAGPVTTAIARRTTTAETPSETEVSATPAVPDKKAKQS